MRRGVAVVGRQEVSFYHLVRGSLSLSEPRVCVPAQIKYYHGTYVLCFLACTLLDRV